MRYFRVQSGDVDPGYLLDPEAQVSEQWGGTDRRPGVSVCESRADLARYLAGPGQGIPYGSGGWILVELEGEELAERGLDWEHGEILVRPTRLVAVTSLDDDEEMWDMISAAYDAAA